QQVADGPLIERQAKHRSPTSERRVEAGLELGLRFRTDQRITGTGAWEGAEVAADRSGGVGGELGAEERLVAGLSERPRQLQLVQSTERLDDPVGSGRLGIEEELGGIAVRAALVGPDAGGEEQPPVHEQQLFLAVDTQVAGRPQVLEDG